MHKLQPDEKKRGCVNCFGRCSEDHYMALWASRTPYFGLDGLLPHKRGSFTWCASQ